MLPGYLIDDLQTVSKISHGIVCIVLFENK